MKAAVLSYLLFLVLFVGIDFVWLGRAGDAIYRPVMGDMALPGFRASPAVAFYLLYALGALVFAIAPGLSGGGWQAAGLRGLAFGLCAYGTYDLTNQATLRNWSTTLTLIDMSWGALLTGAAAATATAIASRLA